VITYREKLKSVAAACVRTNSDILKRQPTDEDLCDRIRLADIKWLLMRDLSKRRCEASLESLSFWWNLEKDALAFQSDECVGFIYDALQNLKW
jgi:hypothetical protein